jgi:hypothetical protein
LCLATSSRLYLSPKYCSCRRGRERFHHLFDKDLRACQIPTRIPLFSVMTNMSFMKLTAIWPESNTRMRSYDKMVLNRSILTIYLLCMMRSVGLTYARCKSRSCPRIQSVWFAGSSSPFLNPPMLYVNGINENCLNSSTGRTIKQTYVASSKTTILESLTSARARLRSDFSPTLKLDPPVSMTVSRVILPAEDSSEMSVELRRECSSTKKERRSASHRRASS